LEEERKWPDLARRRWGREIWIADEVGEEEERWIYFITMYLKVGSGDNKEDTEEHDGGNNSDDDSDLRLGRSERTL
jgi:hypothetical protein